MKYCEALNIFTAFVLFFFGGGEWGGWGGGVHDLKK